MTDERVRQWGLAIGWLGIPITFFLLLAPHWMQSALCPAQTLLSGHLVGAGIAFGAIFCGTAICVAGIGLHQEAKENIAPAKRQTAHRLKMGAVIVAVLGGAFWAEGIFSYYCVLPGAVIVHPDLFASSSTYRPQDVEAVKVMCTHSRGGLSVHFDLAMADGRQVDLGNDSWSKLKRNYRATTGKILPSNYRYDNQDSDCPQDLQALFSLRPH